MFLIYTAHLRKILSFFKKFQPKNKTLKENFVNYFHAISTTGFLALPSEVKTIILYHKILFIMKEKICKTYTKNVSEFCE